MSLSASLEIGKVSSDSTWVTLAFGWAFLTLFGFGGGMVYDGWVSTSERRMVKRSFATGYGRPISAVRTSRRRRYRSDIGTRYVAEVFGWSAGSDVDPWFVRDVDAVNGVVAEGEERLLFFLLGTSGKVDLHDEIKLRRTSAFLLWTGKSKSFFKSLLGTKDWRNFFGGLRTATRRTEVRNRQSI